MLKQYWKSEKKRTSITNKHKKRHSSGNNYIWKFIFIYKPVVFEQIFKIILFIYLLEKLLMQKREDSQVKNT